MNTSAEDGNTSANPGPWEGAHITEHAYAVPCCDTNALAAWFNRNTSAEAENTSAEEDKTSAKAGPWKGAYIEGYAVPCCMNTNALAVWFNLDTSQAERLPELPPICPPHPKLKDNPKLTDNPNEMLKQAKPQDKPKEICTRLTDYKWEETADKETTGHVLTLGRPTPARSKATLLEQEVKKVFDEIQARNNNMDTWYHHKFLLVGGLLAILLTKELLPALHGKDRGPKPEKSTNDFDVTDVAVIVFGAACVVSIAADIHIRIDATMTGMLGRWIANYVEPQVSPTYYWESFIRHGPSVHTSYLTQVTFAPHLHFLTWPMYLLHLWFFQEMALGWTRAEDRRPSKYPMFGVGSFILVQLSLFVFVFVAHSTPYAHDLIVMDYFYTVTWLGAELALWGFLCSLSIPYLRMLIHQMNKEDYLAASHAGDVDG
jgi:hypothetical protein